MTLQNPVVSLDVGTSVIRVVIGEAKNGTIHIVGVGSAPSRGIKNGAIVDIEQTVMSIEEAVDKAEQMVGIKIQSVFVGISGNHIQLTSSHGVVAVANPDKEITEEDVERVINAAKVISIPPERTIIDVIPQQYIVDGLDGISDPRGMLGVRLEVEATIVTGSKTIVHNIRRCVEKAGLQVAHFVLSSMAGGTIALKKDERELGAILVDIGAGGANIAIFEKGNLVRTSVIPVGGAYLTQDIAYGLKTEMENAESVKIKHGCAMVSLADDEEVFKVHRLGTKKDSELNQEELASIIEPRLQEIFQLILKEVQKLGYTKDITAGFFITGGVANLKGLAELAEIEFDAPVQIVMPNYLGVKDSSFTSGVGIIKYVTDQGLIRLSKNSTASSKNINDQASGLLQKIKDWFKDFL
ncbi:cell division protein FtsA [Desulfuribacillus alkaliarsenatis]|uniref:Cell division protein FtsA n=1 Tax=Desulfuribacillus alkaliarsenatis TaxID=766136 RepID=A0A1E5FZW6_9FIRM|nr:cell division protein FtsA [Desulfuribacillus alkaliarsenatis]OEF96070.1 cell division protein FtsA [Desulfuribacillus alkaliarsenatis]